MTDPDDRRGQLAGEYRLERPLGRGGMSVVWLARHEATQAAAAIKILEADLPANIDAEQRLAQEARAILRIAHPHVVQVLGWGRLADGQPYVALEYLRGRTLTEVAGGRALPVARAVNIALQVLSGLEAAHGLNIVHRDLKPDNLFLVERPDGADHVKILDFGIAKLLGTPPHTAVQTALGVVLGTPEYLPPEIALDEGARPASDLYALGAILFELLTGRLPFVVKGAAALAEAHCFAPPPHPSRLNRQIPLGLEHLVLRCLSKQPERRHPSAAALASELRVYAGPTDRPTLVTPPLFGAPTEVPAGLSAAPAGAGSDLGGAAEPRGSRPPGDAGEAAEGLRAAGAFDSGLRLDGAERHLRALVARTFTERTLPGAAGRSFARLQALRHALDTVEVELAAVAALEPPPRVPGALGGPSPASNFEAGHDAAPDASPDSSPGARVIAALDAEHHARDHLHHLDGQEAQVRVRLAALDGALPPVVAAALATEARAGLATLVAGPTLDRVAERLGRAPALEALDAERLTLATARMAAATALADAIEARAAAEAEALLAVARQEAADLRRSARRRPLLARREALRRSLAEALAQCALDLALAPA